MVKLLIACLQSIILLSVIPGLNSQSSGGQVRATPIGVGDIAPDFTLEDQNRNKVTLSDVRGKSHVVLVFYRGYW